MAVVRRPRGYASTRKSVKVGRRRSTIKRPMGAFGLYRGTRAMAVLRTQRYKIRRSLNPFPNTKICRHKYVDAVTVPAGGAAGVPTIYQFRANSMYDPDFTGVGHQPMFRDEMAAQYKYYTVINSAVRVSFPNTDNNTNNYLLWVDDDVNIPADGNTAMEQHSSSLQRLNNRNTPFVLRAKYNAAAWNKTNRAGLMADDQQKTSSGSSPNQSKWYTIFISPQNATSIVAAHIVKVELVFYTVWREPVDHIGS